MKRKSMLALLLAVSMTCSMTAATGAVAYASDDTATEESADDADTTDDAAAEDTDAEDTADDADAADTEEASDDDQKAADEVAALIDKIYVQERNDTTDEDCKAAKEAWDKLTDAQKEKKQALNILDVIQVMLPKMIHVIRMRSVRTNFL